ncbi:MAG: BatD family protein [Planctomycetota bacterium]
MASTKYILALGALILLLGSVPLVAQDLKVRVGMEPQQPVFGEAIIFGIIVTRTAKTPFEGGAPAEVKIPDGDGYKLKYRETRTGKSTRGSTIFGGRRSTYYEDSWTLVYDLVPERTGVIQMPPFSFQMLGKPQRVGSLTFEVLSEAPGNRYATLEVSASNTSPYVNQPVKLRLVITSEKPTVDVKVNLPWSSNPNGFSGPITAVGWTQGRGVAVQLNGERFDFQQEANPAVRGGERLVYERVVYPIAPGRVELAPANLHMDVALRMGRGVFGRRQVRESAKVVLVSQPLVLEVRDAPITGRPQPFTGILGNFSGLVQLGSTSIKAGDGFTLSLQLEGAGELASLTPPDIAAARGFENFDVYAPDKTIEPGARKGDQRLTISWLIVPKLEAKLETFPRWEFSWFKPSTETFETVSVGPTPIEIKGRVSDDGIFGGASNAREAREIMTLGEGLRPIKELPEGLSELAPRVPWAVFLSALILPALLFGISTLFLRRRENLAGDVALQRRRRASKEATARLQEAREHMSSERGFHGKLARSVTGFLGDKLDLPPARIAAATVRDLVQQAGVSAQRGDELATLLQDLESKEFGGGGASAAERQSDFDRAEVLIRALDREIKR